MSRYDNLKICNKCGTSTTNLGKHKKRDRCREHNLAAWEKKQKRADKIKGVKRK